MLTHWHNNVLLVVGCTLAIGGVWWSDRERAIQSCHSRAATRATLRTQIQYGIDTGVVFRDNSKSPVIRAYFRDAVPKRQALLAASPPITC